MNLIPSVASQALGKASLLAKKSSPEVLLAVGIVGMVGSTVLACRATLKMEEVLDEANRQIDETQEVLENHPEKYSTKDQKRDVMLVKYKTSVKIVRLYAPAIIVGAASIYCLTKSHNILAQRNSALAAAYVALDRGFKEYRARVVDRYGEDVDQELRYSSEKVEIVDESTGKKKTVVRVGPHGESIYAKFFDQTNSSWQPDPEYNMIFLMNMQRHMNDKLNARGHLFLNEVYDSLGIERTKAGAQVGWVISGDGETDNFVDFGVFNGEQQIARDFVNGREGAILLDFNVDGPIIEYL